MKVSYNWLKEYIEFDLTPEELSVVLTDIGLEVEGCVRKDEIQGGLRGVVIGKVISTSQHPNADRLKLTQVDVGSEILPIVCGAPNVTEGQKVAVALVGSEIFPSTMPDGLKIKKAKIRGEESQGMICAEDELGLGSSHEGIMVLDESAEIGCPAAEYFKLTSDYQIEIGLTPNRADAMSHFGVARDIKTYLNVNGHAVTAELSEVDELSIGDLCPINVKVEAKEIAPKYLGAVLKGVRVGASPDWLKSKLRSIGLTPVNNVVDITNFVMHETGQPLHAFDANIVKGEIVVRKAQTDEKFVGLDGEEYILHQEDLMICNNNEPMCIAGVLGGEASGVSDLTNTIFIESAWFDPVSVRKSAKRHGLHTDASFRFERGVDPHMTEYALARAVNLIQDICEGKIEGNATAHISRTFDPFEITFSPAECNCIIGEEIEDSYIRKVLTELDIEIEMQGDTWQLKVPPYRVDVLRQSDVIEEILRIYGYNTVAIPEKLNATMAKMPEKDPNYLKNKAADWLSSHGFTQIMNNSLTPKKYYSESDQLELVEMLNPLSQELNVMRSSMVYSGLEVINHNQNRQNAHLSLYEFGKTYHKSENGYKEQEHIALYLSGNVHKESWHGNDKQSFHHLKSYVENLLIKFGVKFSIASDVNILLEDGLSFTVNNNIIAQLGWLKPELNKAFDIKNRVYYADLNWEKLVKAYKTQVVYQEISKFPEVRRDLSLLIDNAIKFDELKQAVLKVNKKMIIDVDLFDVYIGDKLPEGKKSYAISVILLDREKTLVDKQVDQIMNKTITLLEKEFGAILR